MGQTGNDANIRPIFTFKVRAVGKVKGKFVPVLSLNSTLWRRIGGVEV
jgi:hypothetical protein